MNNKKNTRSPYRKIKIFSIIFIFTFCSLWIESSAEKMMYSNEASIKRISKVTPGKKDKSKLNESIVSFTHISDIPIVLWSGEKVPAVFYYSLSVNAIWMGSGIVEQKIINLERGSGKNKSIVNPIVFRNNVSPEHHVGGVSRTIAADIDGDGLDELILIHGAGSEGPGDVEVYKNQKRIFRWNGAGDDYRHLLISQQVARIGGKDIVHFALKRFDDFKRKNTDPESEPYSILRIDDKKISVIRLQCIKLQKKEIEGIGAYSKPGSDKLDEIIAIYSTESENGKIYFSRHKPDGEIISKSRRGDGHGYYGHDIQYIPGTDIIVSFYRQDNQLYIADPEEHENWVKQLDINSICKEGRGRFVGVIDPLQYPKILYSCNENLYARNLRGIPIIRTEKGWIESVTPQPFYSAPAPEKEQRLYDIQISRDRTTLLLSYTRPYTLKKLSTDEIMTASSRFINDAEHKDIEKRSAVRFPNNPWELKKLDDKRRKLGIIKPIQNLDEWKAAMPEDFEEEKKISEDNRRFYLKTVLTSPLFYSGEITAEKYKNIREYRDWLSSLILPAKTSFVLLKDGITIMQATVPGTILNSRDDLHFYGELVHWRYDGDSIVIILPMDNGEGELKSNKQIGKQKQIEGGFYMIEIKSELHIEK